MNKQKLHHIVMTTLDVFMYACVCALLYVLLYLALGLFD